MICVRIEEKGGVYAIHAMGHANTAPAGQDIVCAAASILMYTAMECVEQLHQRGRLLSPPDYIDADGIGGVGFRPIDASDIMPIVDVLQTGFRLLQTNYPEAVRLVSHL